MKNKTVWTPRVAAAKAISGVLSQHHSLAVTLPHATQKLEPADRALAQEISYGVLRHIYELEGIAKQLLKRSFKNKDGDLHALILSGIYQLHYMRTPDHAALSETVNAVKILKKEWASGVVNAVLRRFQRESESLTGPNKKTLAEKNNHPDWMVQKLRDSWPQQWRDILHHNIRSPSRVWLPVVQSPVSITRTPAEIAQPVSESGSRRDLFDIEASLAVPTVDRDFENIPEEEQRFFVPE